MAGARRRTACAGTCRATCAIEGRARSGNGRGHCLWRGMLSSHPGQTGPQMVEAAQSGKLKALYVVGANPLVHFGKPGEGRGKLELLIVQEMFLTETAKAGDIVLPAASAYEKDGTVT